ncbi:MAG: hypothetical protein ACRDQZ_18255 [Mycobacteriales bacterium]
MDIPLSTTPRRGAVLPLLQEIAAELGLDFVVEPDYGFAAQLNLANGHRRYFRGTTFDLNPAGATDIANDKDYSNFFLRRLGYNVPEGAAFFTRAWARAIGIDRGPDAAWAYARSLGLPVYVKPNTKSQGLGVSLAHNRREFYRAVTAASREERVYLVQRPALGLDYRLVTLDGDLISAYERAPLAVVGDGASTVRQLLAAKQASFRANGRDTRLDPADGRIASTLAHHGLALESVLAESRQVQLLPIANLSAGGDARDVTDSVHPEWHRLSAMIARDMNLRFAGIDVITPGALAEPPAEYVILEVNAAPGLDNYAASGDAQSRLVRDLYRRVLDALADD